MPVKVIPNGGPLAGGGFDKLRAREKARLAFGLTQKARLVISWPMEGPQAVYKSGDAWLRIWQSIKQQSPDAVCFMIGGRSSGLEGS